jgi:hypothetical protein
LKKTLLFTLLIWTIGSVNAGGVKGILSSFSGEPLPYATIYIDQIQSGTTTNQSGFFEITLAPGVYDLVFQYMGYKTVSKRVQIGNGFFELNVVLKENSVELKSATIYAGKEDPAYTLMRKAIAKAPFHLQELNWYTAQVYMKGSGRVIDAPFFIRKKLAEEGFDSTTAYISETVTNVRFERPNTYKQTVISTRTSGSNNNSAQNRFVFGSFYQPNIGGWISPLSPKAFSHYRFKYIESFEDRGYTINKIQVVPRSRGDNVVEGYLYLVENDWNIYRLNFVTYNEGIKIIIRGVSAPIEPKIWLPVTLKFDVTGSYFGVDFEYNYLATIGDYKIEINPELDFDIEVIDEKLDKELATQIEDLDKKLEKSDGKQTISEKKDAKVTRKQLKKLLQDYEEKVEEETETKDVVRNYGYEIDSLANTKDSAYWAQIRSVPLDSNEIRGYQKLDSIMVVDEEEKKADSVKKSTFSPLGLVFGHTFKFSDTSSLRVSMPFSFNTVDGFMVGAKLRHRYKFNDSNMVQVSGQTHYGFSRTTLLGFGEVKYLYGGGLNKGSVSVSGGIMDVQINEDIPIDPIVNSLTTLFMEDNFMKLYQKEYLKFRWAKYYLNTKFKAVLSTEFARRTNLENTTDFTFIKYHNRGYTGNKPNNVEYGVTSSIYAQTSMFLLNARFEFQPWQKTVITNGKQRLLNDSSPMFWLDLKQSVFTENGSADFNKLSIGYKQYVKVNGANRLRINAQAGATGTPPTDFVDYNHFMGNESPFVSANPANEFRMLSYYGHSTANKYASVLVNYEFRKLALTQLFFVRMTGLKENLFANYLYTDFDNFNYAEFGYSIDNIFRVLRVEVVTNTLDDPFTNWAVRFGVSTNLAVSFSE